MGITITMAPVYMAGDQIPEREYGVAKWRAFVFKNGVCGIGEQII